MLWELTTRVVITSFFKLLQWALYQDLAAHCEREGNTLFLPYIRLADIKLVKKLLLIIVRPRIFRKYTAVDEKRPGWVGRAHSPCSSPRPRFFCLHPCHLPHQCTESKRGAEDGKALKFIPPGENFESLSCFHTPPHTLQSQ
jgi:hypothetical protein